MAKLGPSPKTQEELVAKIKAKYGDKYDLSEVNYVNMTTRIVVTCKECGTRKSIIPRNLLISGECKVCRVKEMGKKNTKSQSKFISDSKAVHGENTYGYENVYYINSRTPVTLFCKKHKKYFNKVPHNHIINKQGCPDCGKEQARINRKKTLNKFIYDAQEIHGTEHYDYTKTVYTDCREPVTIYCNYCKEEFTVQANSHLQGVGCGECSKKEFSKKKSMPFSEFKDKSEKIHNKLYTYKESSYTKATETLIVICPQHGEFTQRGTNHLRGAGCSICKNSKGELNISNWLAEHNLKNDPQKYFPECKHNGALLFDFFIPELDLLIEYHGRQHYEYVEFFHKTEEGFQERLLRDKIKQDYAEANHNFLVIPYWDFENIETILEEKIKELSKK